MLNRNAEALFWVGRYMERTENHARLIDVHYYQHHDGDDEGETVHTPASDKWLRIVDALGSRNAFEQKFDGYREEDVLFYITLDRDNENSLFSCVQHARGNLRTLREKLPSELWDVVNAFYLWLREEKPEAMLRDSPHRFLLEVKEWTALFLGTAQSVMPRENEWYFMACGRYLERAENTLRILQSVRNAITDEPTGVSAYTYMQAVLKSVSGYQVFRRYHADGLSLDVLFEFLVLHSTFPRSLHFALKALEKHVKGIELQEASLKNAHHKLIRQTGKLMAELSCMERDDLMQEPDGQTIDQLLTACGKLGTTFADTFFRLKEVSA